MNGLGRRIALAGWLIAASAPAGADVVFLKGGQRLEGTAQEKGDRTELTTALGVVAIPKSEILKVVPAPEELRARGAQHTKEARVLFDEATKPEADPAAANLKLKAGIDLLKKAVDLYHELLETYEGDEQKDVPKLLVTTFQEIRIYRDRMRSDVAGPPPPPEKPKPEEPAVPPAEKAAVPAVPPTPPSAPPATALAAALLAKAKAGDLDAMHDLGLHYLFAERKPSEAMKWFKQAAEKNHAKSMYRYGRVSLWAIGDLKMDWKEAQKWLRRAGDRGHAVARVYLAMQHHGGFEGRRPNYRTADDLCDQAAPKIRKEAEAGDSEAQCLYGWMLETGMGVRQDPKAAAEWYRRASDQGSGYGSYLLGLLYAAGNGVEKDLAEAYRCYEKAEKVGYHWGLLSMAWSHWGGHGVPKDFGKAAELYKIGVQRGYAEAKHRLGQMYREGEGLPKDEAECFRLWLAAAEQGNTNAVNDVGFCLATGKGVARNEAEAVRWYKQSAEMGNAYGMLNLAHKLMDARQAREGVVWYREAAQRGLALAMHYLGDACEKGTGVAKDLRAALWWYLAAAQKGHEEAKKAVVRLDPKKR
jgi:TPR repeat protein